MSSKLLRPLIIFLILLIGVRLFLNPEEPSTSSDAVLIQAESEIILGNEVGLMVTNNTAGAIGFPNGCPEAHLNLQQYQDGEFVDKESPLKCNNESITTLAAGESYSLSYQDQSWEVFSDLGEYRLSLDLEIDGREKNYLHDLEIVQPSGLRVFWRELFYKPILNVLIFILSVLPGNNLGWAVILLTLLIKVILWVPNNKALKSQKAMQKLQPELEAIKLKHGNDQAVYAQKTMELWKKHKVSPAGSCLPMLIQFPVLIGLFYVVRDGLSTINPTLLYGSLKTFDPSTIDPIFLGALDITKINYIVLPIIVGGLQFLQMQLTMGRSKKGHAAPATNPLPGMQQMMKYGMPIMIAIFTATLPAVVGIYWGTSTLFGLFQQLLINRGNLVSQKKSPSKPAKNIKKIKAK